MAQPIHDAKRQFIPNCLHEIAPEPKATKCPWGATTSARTGLAMANPYAALASKISIRNRKFFILSPDYGTVFLL